jgi:hypothetical protein
MSTLRSPLLNAKQARFGLSAIGWLAAAIYGTGMLAVVADGCFGQDNPRRQPT